MIRSMLTDIGTLSGLAIFRLVVFTVAFFVSLSESGAQSRTWTSSDGSRTFKGELRSYVESRGMVVVVGQDERIFVFSRDKLSDDDIAFLENSVGGQDLASGETRHETHATSSLSACQLVANVDEGIDHLARKLIQAISVNDPIAYAQCFTTVDQTLDGLQVMFPRITEKELNRFRKKFHDRNVGIRHSFDIIRKQIPETESKVVFVSAEAEGFEDIDAIDATSCSTIRLRFSIDGLPWTLTLDDGILLGNYWYLGDDPVSLESERTKINLRMFKGEYGHETTKQPTP